LGSKFYKHKHLMLIQTSRQVTSGLWWQDTRKLTKSFEALPNTRSWEIIYEKWIHVLAFSWIICH